MLSPQLQFDPVSDAMLVGYLRLERKMCQQCGRSFNREIPMRADLGARYCTPCETSHKEQQVKDARPRSFVRNLASKFTRFN